MNLFSRRVILTLAVLPVFIILFPTHANAQGQSTTCCADSIPAVIVSPAYEIKIVDGKFQVRERGSQEWKRASEITEPIVINQLDGEHKIYVVTKAIRPPKPTHTQAPAYPPTLKKSGTQGQVLMHLEVDEQGAVRFPTVDVTSRPEFSEASIKAVEKWGFKPATLDGHPVAVVIVVTMNFKLP